MKTKRIFKNGLGFFLLISVICIPLNNFANTVNLKSIQTEDVIITIDNKTSDTDLEEVKAMLSEHDVIVTFSKVKRNENEELTGIRVTLEDKNGSQTVSSEFSGNLPMSKLTFGIKDGTLFINQGDRPNHAMSSFNFPNITLGFPNDSIFGQSLRSFNFQDFFRSSNDSIFLKEHADIQKLMEQMQQGFNTVIPKRSKYKFIDNPDLDKLIIINGKESNFETLNNLAETDQLEDVETLSPNIAMSIYGDKAKDGAIVATSKK
ncbi:hypothetical protein [Aestuariivivens sediminis]|uniref:hypothetical protein n=1 Tax=Aestuariivivens sediminis TaxID=2913557 RepID=UPI001F593D77|nr:hypothetical protein [Aestuariivivens sediminis]